MTKPAVPQVDPIVAKLDALVCVSPDLKPIAVLYAAILPLLRDADLRVEPVTLTVEQACVKLQAGVPLLHNALLAFDETAARALMIGLARAVEELPENAPTPRQRARLFQRAAPDTSALSEIARADHARP